MADTNKKIRIPLSGLLGLIVVFLLAGAGGAWVTVQLQEPAQVGSGGSREVTTVRNVTISPGSARAQLIQNARRGVYTIASISERSVQALATGVALTNDGLIATTRDIEADSLSALDNSGNAHEITRIGRDQVYGITYYRIAENVAPFELAPEDPPVGASLAAISRNENGNVAAYARSLISYEVAGENSPGGIMRYGQLEAGSKIGRGAVVLDEEGRIAGLMTAPSQHEFTPASALQASFDRVAQGRRTENVFSDLGFEISPDYTFRPEEGVISFAATVRNVQEGSVSAQAGLRGGDRIVRINDTAVTNQTLVEPLLAGRDTMQLRVRRGGDTVTISINSSQEN